MRITKRRRLTLSALALFVCAGAFTVAEPAIGISGEVVWDRMEINASVSLDLASADIKLPGGRTQGEAIIETEYLRLVRPVILNLRLDSASSVADLVSRGDWSFLDVERFALAARTVPPALSPDLQSLQSAYTLSLAGLSAALVRHSRPAEIPRTLSPVPTAAYTGIIIIASESLPVHGRKSAALTLPCVFPKIWDTDMNLIFERNMLQNTSAPMVRYAAAKTIFRPGPSGLSPDITAITGERPLRIFARGVFGQYPTDPVIDRDDALLIISSEENRRLLREGRVLIILDDSTLNSPLLVE
jgi:hypothetical protein